MDLLLFIILFFTAILLMHQAEGLSIKKMRYQYLLVIIILILVVPATIRDISVGTDIKTYQYSIYRVALRSNSIKRFLAIFRNWDIEYGYLLLEYLVTKIFRNIHVFFFVEEICMIVPIIYFCWNNKDKVPASYSLMVYLLLFYLETFNTARQQMALSIIAIVLLLIEKKKYVQGTVITVLAMLFHKTAIIAIVFLVLHKIFISDLKFKKAIIISVYAFASFVSLFYRSVLNVLSRFELVPERYLSTRYISRKDGTNFPLFPFIIGVFVLIMLLVLRHNTRFKRNWFDWLICLDVLILLGIPLTSNTTYLARIYWYIEILWMIDLGLVLTLMKNRTSRLIYFVGSGVALLVDMIYMEYIIDAGGVFPYTTSLNL